MIAIKTPNATDQMISSVKCDNSCPPLKPIEKKKEDEFRGVFRNF
jgi:hypothetical protein